uniref:DHHW family protein n=1 Tax=Agathobacter sp. TaxID=2021311 RepID=UPI004056A3CD
MKKEKVITVCVLIFLALEFISLPINYITNRLQREESPLHSVAVDWESLYPFEGEEASKNSVVNTIIDKYESLCTSLTYRLELLADEYSIARTELVELSVFLQKQMGMYIVKDSEYTTVALESGQLHYLRKLNPVLNQTVTDITVLRDEVENLEMDFIYVQAPSKLFGENDIIPGVIDNYDNADEDILCARLLEKDVDVIDLREYMPEKYESYMSFFYDTDHHWRIEAGIYATSILAEQLNNRYGFKIDVSSYDLKKFDKTTYENAFLGSQGRKITAGYSKPEDFIYYKPQEPQDWTVSVPAYGIKSDGDFEIAMNLYDLESNSDLYTYQPYNAYLYGNQAYFSIVNNDIEADKRVLIIGDSFNEAIVPFLAMECKQVDRIDMRHFTGSLQAFLKENAYYDVVMVVHSKAGEEYDASLHNSGWDFR